MKLNNRTRLVVLGLDGLPFSLVKKLGQTKDLPNLCSLIQAKNCYPIQADLPEISPVNWTSFYTASGPEKHGIFGFTNLDPSNYSLYCVDFSQVKVPTLFDKLGEQEYISKIINLPNTYPARPIKGMLISGFVALDLFNAVYPKFLAPKLQAEGYHLEADTSRGSADYNHLLSELNLTLESRRKALDLFWPDLTWDLFIFVLTEMDRLGHFLFPALLDQNDPFHLPCLQVLKKMDSLVGEILNRFYALPEPKRLLIMADHGFTELKIEIDLNVWLRQQGLLAYTHPPATEWDSTCISPKTKAFALDPGRIYLHYKQKFSRGCLSSKEKLPLREEILLGLQNLTYQQEPVFKNVWRKEELYPNCDYLNCPDLICTPNPGFDLKTKFDRKDIFGFFGRKGTHTPDDVFFFDSQDKSDVSSVRDVGKEVLDFFHKPQKVIATNET